MKTESKSVLSEDQLLNLQFTLPHRLTVTLIYSLGGSYDKVKYHSNVHFI